MDTSKNNLVFSIQELDRKRIAKELHDSSLQDLAHLIHKLELASLYIDKDIVQAKQEITSISKDINSIINEIRNVIYDLRPMIFDDLGLKEALEKNLNRVKKASDMTIISDIDELHLDDDSVKIGIFRIVQECINNACKHSRGTKLEVYVKNRADYIEILVQDDGIGFEFDEPSIVDKHFGLIVLKERVESISGKIKIISAPNKGTKVRVIILK